MKEIYVINTSKFETEHKDSTPGLDYDAGGDGDTDEFKGLDKGWSWMVLFASFGTCCIIGANNYGTGIIHKILLERYRESSALTSLSGALQVALVGIAAPLASVIINNYSCRTSMILSGLLFGSAYWATAFAPSMHVAIFTCGVMAGTAAGVGYTASIVAINYNFKRRTNVALGVAMSGIGAGIFAFAPLMEFANEYYGSTGFFIIMATMSINNVTFGALCFPSKLELYTHEQRTQKAKLMRNKRKKANLLDNMKMYWYAVAKKPILLLCISIFGFSCGTDLIFIHLPTIVISSGFTFKNAALIVSLNGAMTVVGRLLTGLFSSFQNKHTVWLFVVSLAVVSTSTVIFAFTLNTFKGHITYTILLGLFFGGCYVMVSPLCLLFLDINFAATAIGLVLFFSGAGTVIGPFLAGIILDAGGTYKQCIITAGCFVSLATAFAIPLTCIKHSPNDDLDKMVLATKYSRRASRWVTADITRNTLQSFQQNRSCDETSA